MDSPSAKAKVLEKATRLQPVPVQKTLLMINHFSVSTVTFLNQFVRTVDERLEVFSKSMDKLDVLLAILEAKLEKIEGPPAPAPAPAPAAATAEATPASQGTATAAAPAMAPNAASGAPPPPPPGGGPPPPPGGGPPPPPGGGPPPPPGAGAGTAAASPPPPAQAAAAPGSVRADPQYAQYFSMLASGTPKNEVVFKMQSAGLNASLLDTPDAPAPSAGAPNGAAGESPMLEIMDAPSTVLKCKDDPAFKKYFRMLNIGIPEGNVKQKMTTDGVDPSILDTPDGPSPNDPASTAVM
eukprot:INCI17442.1.p1 GENE.INCI17442.1~~INCI17442.1.p1  ORF type:complete len:296 (-),score=50.00 INCI17442.1:582-1469(-)